MPVGADPDPHELDADQTLSDRDQTLSDGDQTASDGDQSNADRDQTASDRDQESSDRDQLASDRDQAARPEDEEDDPGYQESRRGRSLSSLERDISTDERSQTARARQVHADQRDALARWRDGAADMRDRIADVQDEQEAQLDGAGGADGRVLGMQVLLNAVRDRERAAANRARAAANRKAAAADRDHAAEDRRQAALDRAAAAHELAAQGLDHLTGTLRRQAGLAAMERELDRTTRYREPLVLAFIDVDGLKAVNDRDGHAAGDALLRAVSGCVKSQLRSYDVIARYGGDEFIVSLAGQPADGVRARFDVIAEKLAHTVEGASITVGLAERQPQETLEALIGRADAAMREGRWPG